MKGGLDQIMEKALNQDPAGSLGSYGLGGDARGPCRVPRKDWTAGGSSVSAETPEKRLGAVPTPGLRSAGVMVSGQWH